MSKTIEVPVNARLATDLERPGWARIEVDADSFICSIDGEIPEVRTVRAMLVLTVEAAKTEGSPY